jgi:2'-5' RNA ligase
MSSTAGAVERLFFAVVPDTATIARIAAAAAALPPCAGGRPVAHRNYHVTLAFVGEIPSALVSVLHEIGGAQRCDRFTLRFDAFEYWPKPEVVVTAARVIPPALEQLWHRLHSELALHQWAMQPKRLRPHVTLTRKVAQAPVLPAMTAFEWTVSEFSLMRSEPGDARSAYTVVDTWPLLDDSVKT